MPTPESAAFLAKKPKVAPTFEGVDYDDNVALKAAQDAILREQWVRSMMARLVRDELGKCYRREGVNHLEKCGHLRGMFIPPFRSWVETSRYKEDYWAKQLLIEAIQSDTSRLSRTQRSRDTSSRRRTTLRRMRRSRG
jgi:hypothetical protein